MRSRVLLLVLTVASLVSCVSTRRSETGFLDRSLTAGGRESRYVVYVPRDAAGPLPVILSLHGAGERGSEGMRPTQVGLGPAVRWMPERFPALIVFPQVPPDERWLGAPAAAAMEALEATIREFGADRERIYLTGLSMGGYGVWHMATAYPDVFAALVPVCGGIVPAGSATSVRQSPLTLGEPDPYAFTATRVASIPTWIFHGADDTVVLPSESRRMHEALQAVGAGVRLTVYEGVGHNSWDRAYGEAELWEWLFRQRRED